MAPKRPKKLSGTFPQRKRKQNKPKVSVKSNDTVKPNVTKAAPPTSAQKELEVLKKFDLTLEYGPCIGITRMERWERAKKHDLNPPAEVKEIISRHKDDETYVECLWYDYTILK